MTNDDAHDFLRSRRARITPEMVGLSPGGGTRRVPGLRREEVALLAGISVDYYNRFERGNLAGASESVLDSLARALRLDDAERAHLFDLARAASSGPRIGRRRSTPKLRASVQQLLDGMTTIPAFVQNGRLDVLGMNDLARALYHRDEDPEAKPQNFARYLFLDPASIDELADWRGMAEDVVAILRQEAGRDPHSTELSNLIGELSTRSSDFRSMWASHRVRFHRTGTKQFHHPDVGDLELSFEAMQLPGDDGLTLIAYSAEPGTRSHDALALLASLRATARRQDAPAAVREQDLR